MNLEAYEKEQISAIEKWKEEKPSVVRTALGFVLFPISVSIQSVIPRSAIRSAIEGTSTAAKWLADEGDVRRKGEVSEIDELRTKDLRLSDKLANEVHQLGCRPGRGRRRRLRVLGDLGIGAGYSFYHYLCLADHS